MSKECCVIITTTDDRKVASLLTTVLLEQKLAACVQVDKIASVYNWQGEVIKSREYRLSIKTLVNCFDRIDRVIRECHNYQTPQIIQLNIVGGYDLYLDWIADSVVQ